MTKAPAEHHRFDSSTTTTSQTIRSTLSPNDNGPSPCDEGPLLGNQVGWLMGLEMAT